MSPEYLLAEVSIWQWLGVTTLPGLIALVLAFIYLPPKLTITEIKDKSPVHSFESRIIVKNIGKLPAYEIWANVYGLSSKMGGMQFGGTDLVRNGKPIQSLSGNETFELPALPQVGMSPGMPLDTCEYKLEIEYLCTITFIDFPINRCWDIELRKFNDGFAWQFKPH